VSASSTDPDFLIVGAGAAGGVVAKELATAGFRVVVLEQGPWLREPDFKHDEIWANRRHALTNDHARQPNTRRLTESETATLQPTVSYGRGVGGGSVHFTANYWRFRETNSISLDPTARDAWVCPRCASPSVSTRTTSGSTAGSRTGTSSCSGLRGPSRGGSFRSPPTIPPCTCSGPAGWGTIRPARWLIDRTGSSFVTGGRGQPTCTIQALAYRAGAEITRLAREGARWGGRAGETEDTTRWPTHARRSPIATEIAPTSTFYRAEEYHQRYLEKHGLANCHLP